MTDDNSIKHTPQLTDDELASYERDAANMRTLAALRSIQQHPELHRELRWLRYRLEQAECGAVSNPDYWKPQVQLLTELIALLEARHG